MTDPAWDGRLEAREPGSRDSTLWGLSCMASKLRVETDVCVVGGGMAGVCAALAAARNGAKVALVQDRPVLGGNASSEIRMHICGADTRDDTWRETGILEELRLDSLAWNDEHNPYHLDLALYDACRREPKIQLFLNAQMTACRVEPPLAPYSDGGESSGAPPSVSPKVGKKVISCEARELTSDRTIHIEANYFIDASGDGALAFAAGAEFMRGTEGRDRFGESLAPEKGSDDTLGHTIMFQASDTGRPTPFTPPPWALKFEREEDLPFRSHSGPFGFWWIEWGGTMDTITDSEAIKDELIAAALGVWDHMKNHGDHGFANYSLSWLGFIPGRRESRRFVGEVIMTQSDLQSGRQWPDQIAYGGWPIDTHPALGFRSPERPCAQTALEKPFGVPLRACYCKGFDNLFLAGRNVSASHVAFASMRIMATCALIGQGVGTAAAVAARHGITAEVIDRYIGEVQQALLNDGCYLLDIRNCDPTDLARSARIAASSFAGQRFTPERVIDGYNHPDKADTHCWRSDPAKGFPAWLELRWPEPVEIGQVRVVLDTDFESKLTMTQSPDYRAKTKPVPRWCTLKDFDVEVEDAGRWRTAAAVRGNYQRLVRIEFVRAETSAVRIVARSAWAADYASVIEVACLPPHK